MSEERTIKVSDVLAMLDTGKTREEIGSHYGLNKSDLAYLFKHPSLKGKRAKKKRNFVIEDDVTGNIEVSVSTETVTQPERNDEDSEPDVKTEGEPVNDIWDNENVVTTTFSEEENITEQENPVEDSNEESIDINLDIFK